MSTTVLIGLNWVLVKTFILIFNDELNFYEGFPISTRGHDKS